MTDHPPADPERSDGDGGAAPRQPRSDLQTLAVLTHLSALVWLIGIPGVVGPLVMWLIYRQDPDLEPHGREALNFHLSMLIYGAALIGVGILAAITIVGLLLIPVLLVAGAVVVITELVLTIVGGVTASKGEVYRYPLSLRLIA